MAPRILRWIINAVATVVVTALAVAALAVLLFAEAIAFTLGDGWICPETDGPLLLGFRHRGCRCTHWHGSSSDEPVMWRRTTALLNSIQT
jgi:hypothetical protein